MLVDGNQAMEIMIIVFPPQTPVDSHLPRPQGQAHEPKEVPETPNGARQAGGVSGMDRGADGGGRLGARPRPLDAHG